MPNIWHVQINGVPLCTSNYDTDDDHPFSCETLSLEKGIKEASQVLLVSLQRGRREAVAIVSGRCKQREL